MATLIENLQSRFATKEELAELNKAIQTTETADVMITVDYDAELQKRVAHQSPLLAYLEKSGCVSDAQTAKVGYRVKKQVDSSQFIPETGEIPAHDPSLFEDKIAKMTTLVYPIEVSDMALRGVDTIDLLADEITDGFLDMAQVKDKALLQGTKADNGFNGIIPSIDDASLPSTDKHITDNGGNPIERDTLDALAQELIDDGGNPTAILTSAKVGRQLNDILYPTVRNVDKVELTLGNWVTGYNAPNGKTIPILVDPNLDTTNGDSLVFMDTNTLRVRELEKPTMAELAKTKLTTSRVLYTYFTFYNRAPYRNGLIKNIGDE